MAQRPIVAIVGGGPAGMSCALWLHNYELKPVIIEREAALGGMARRSPYPNEWLLGRAHESARENASAFTRHMAEISVATWLGAPPPQGGGCGGGHKKGGGKRGALFPATWLRFPSLRGSARNRGNSAADKTAVFCLMWKLPILPGQVQSRRAACRQQRW